MVGSPTVANVARLNFTGNVIDVNSPVTISNTGAGLVGLVFAGGITTWLNKAVTNTSTSGFAMLGAEAGATLSVSRGLAGGGNWQFSAGSSGGAGVVALNGTASATGDVVVNTAPAGVVRLGANNALPAGHLRFGNGSGLPGADANTGAVNLNGFSQSVLSLSSGGTGTANGIANTTGTLSTLTITGSATASFGGTIGIPAVTTNLSGATNAIALTLAAAHTGRLTLTGANTYTGATTIDGGTLWVNGSLGNTAVAVNGGTLGGTGTVGGAVTVAGTLAPGNSIGTLRVDNNVTISGSYQAELGAAAGDQLNLSNGSNTLNFADGSTEALIQSGFNGSTFIYTLADLQDSGPSLLKVNGADVAPNTTITTFTSTGGSGGTVSNVQGNVNITLTGFNLTNGDTLTLRRTAGGDLVVVFTPVPEPGTVLGVCALAAGGVAAWRRWRRK